MSASVARLMKLSAGMCSAHPRTGQDVTAGEMLGVEYNLASTKSEGGAPVVFENPQTNARPSMPTCIAPEGQRSSKGRTIFAPLQIIFKSTSEWAAANPRMLDAPRKSSAPQAATSRKFLLIGSLRPTEIQVQAAKVTSVTSAGAPTNQYRPTIIGCLRDAIRGSETNNANATPNAMKNGRVSLSSIPKTRRRIRRRRLKPQPTAIFSTCQAALKTHSGENSIQPSCLQSEFPTLSQITIQMTKTTQVDSP